MKGTVLLVGGVLAAGGVYYYYPRGLDQAAASDRYEDSLFAVRRGDLKITVTENGYLKSKNSVQLKPKFRGQSVITWLIDEGTAVKLDDVLVKFDDTEIRQQLEETQNNLIQYQTELEASKADLEIASRENEAGIEKAALALEISQLTLERYEKGEHPNNLRKNNLTLEKAQSEYQRAQERFEKVPELEKEGFLTSIQVEEERINLREAQINLENAEKDLELYTKYTRPMELKQKETEVKDATRTLETARQKADINTKEKEANVSRKEGLVRTTEQRIELINKDLEAMQIKAPQAGLVLYGDPRNSWQRDQVKIGNPVYQGWVIITLPDLTEMQVLIDIHEADIAQVKLDQKAVITLDTYAGRIFTGKVTHVASVASSTDWGDDTNKQFRVELTMDELDIEVRAGITAKVEIEIETLVDVLYVPIHAVFKEGEEYFCFQPDPKGGFLRRTVKIGRNNTHYVALDEGLAEGDRVLLYDPREEGLSERGAEAPEPSETEAPLSLEAGGEPVSE